MAKTIQEMMKVYEKTENLYVETLKILKELTMQL